MKDGRFLLDTNIVIRLLCRDTAVAAQLAEAPETFSSIITIGELYFGAYKSDRFASEAAKIERFANIIQVLPCDYQTSLHYSRIKDALRRKGRPIPENDIWVAAIAQQYDLTLVHQDRHFDEVQDLKTAQW